MLPGKLKHWQKAGLISEETAAAIAEYESARHKPLFLYSVVCLGALSIAIGIISIVAANYYKIPYDVRLGGALGFLTLLAWLVYKTYQSQKLVLFEVLLIIFFGSIAAMVGLIGQVYNTNSPTYVGLVFWLLVSLPVVLFARSNYFPYLWCFAVGGTVLLLYGDHSLSRFMDGHFPMTFYLVIPSFTFLLLDIALRKYAHYRQACMQVGWLILLVSMSVLCLMAPYKMHFPKLLGGDIAILSTVLLSYGAWLRFSTPQFPTRQRNSLMLFFIFLLGLVLTIYSVEKMPAWIAAGIFLLLWTYVAHLAAIFRAPRLFGLAIFVIGARLFGIYLEVFGSLLETGIGLIVTGLVVLALVWIWLKKRQLLRRWLGGWHD